MKEADAAIKAGDLELANRIEIDSWVVGLGRMVADVDPSVYDLALDMNLTALRYEQLDQGDPEPPMNADGLAKLRDFTQPLLVIYGANDRAWVEQAATDMVGAASDAKLVRLQNAGHLPNLEHPEAFNRALLSFLDTCSRESR